MIALAVEGASNLSDFVALCLVLGTAIGLVVGITR